MNDTALEVRSLSIDYVGRNGTVRSLDGADLVVQPGEIVGVVGESGSGKSTLAAAIGRILPTSAERSGGDVTIFGRSVFGLDDRSIRELRRKEIGFVFQNPISTLDPTKRIGKQMRGALAGTGADIGDMLRSVGLADPKRVLSAYPHQLSGGMAQRVAIAIAMARKPRLLVADEPTASLDRTVQATIMELLVQMSRADNTALVIFTHDLRAVAQYCDRVVVMYGGRPVEDASCSQIFDSPLHPYSQGLLAAAVGVEDQGDQLKPIPGAPPVLHGTSIGCSFAPRCTFADDTCRQERPEMRDVAAQMVACHHAERFTERITDLIAARMPDQAEATGA